MRSLFVTAQARNGDIVTGITHQVIATDALDGHYIAGLQCGYAGRQCGFVAVDLCIARHREFERRSTRRTGDRFGMKAPVERVGIFAAAVITEFERGHGRGRAVVGHATYQRVTWPALGTVNKRIVVTPITGVVQFREAIVAGKQIRGYMDVGGTGGGAVPNGKGIEVIHRGWFAALEHRFRQRWCVLEQPACERV